MILLTTCREYDQWLKLQPKTILNCIRKWPADLATRKVQVSALVALE
jgi:hypothetical protein